MALFNTVQKHYNIYKNQKIFVIVTNLKTVSNIRCCAGLIGWLVTPLRLSTREGVLNTWCQLLVSILLHFFKKTGPL